MPDAQRSFILLILLSCSRPCLFRCPWFLPITFWLPFTWQYEVFIRDGSLRFGFRFILKFPTPCCRTTCVIRTLLHISITRHNRQGRQVSDLCGVHQSCLTRYGPSFNLMKKTVAVNKVCEVKTGFSTWMENLVQFGGPFLAMIFFCKLPVCAQALCALPKSTSAARTVMT